MEDIQALRLLTKEIQNIKTLPNPPSGHDGIEKYETTVTKVIDHVIGVAQDVSGYGEAITARMEAMRSAVEQSTKKIQEQLKKTFELKVSEDVGTYHPPVKIINYAMQLQKLVVKNQRLEESILKTQEIMDKIKQGVAITAGDIEQLRGSINQWHEEKEQSNQEEQNRPEAKTEAEENRKRKEEEKMRKKEEELRKKEEKSKREEEEGYRRPDGESDAFHRGICCQVSAIDGSLLEEDLECLASDEYHEEDGLTLAVGDKLASSLIQVLVKETEKDLKFPLRVYVPLCSVSDSSDEIIVKVSIDNGNWIDRQPVSIPTAQTSQSGMSYTGIDVSNFHTVKLLAVTKSRSQELLVDQGGISQASTIDKGIKLFVPKDTFSKPTKMNLKIQQIKENSLAFAIQYYKNCHNVLSTSSVMTITCETPTEKDIELDLSRNATKDKRTNDKGRYIHMYKCMGDNWNIAGSETKGRNMDAAIKLPSRKDNYVVLEIEGRMGIQNEEFLKAADELFFHSNASIVRIVAKQKSENPHIIMIQCVRSEQVSLRVPEMERLGYSLGPDTSREFALIDGQSINVTFSGNIAMTAESEVKLSFHAYMDTAKQEVYLEVLDEYKQKNLDVYHGYLHFEVLKDDREGTIYSNTKGSLPITLPKTAMKRPKTSRATIRLPHYLITLAKFLAMKLTTQSNDDTWLQVIYRLGSHDDMEYIRRRAITRCETAKNSRQICEIILQDWMKSKPVQEDKMKPIISALRGCQRTTLSDECEKYVHFHTNYLSDTCMSEMAKKINDDWPTLAINLGLSSEDIKRESKGSDEAARLTMWNQWRVSDAVITSGLEVFNDLLGKVETTQIKDNGLKEHISHVIKQINKE